MRTAATILSLMLIVPALSSVSAATEPDQVSAAIKTKIESSFPNVKVDSVAPSPWPGMYEIVVNGQITYSNKDASLMFSGKIIDTNTKVDLTTKRWNELNKVDFSTLPLDKAIKTVRGDGSRKLAVFADPLCSFCAKLEGELANVDNITIYTFLFPLEGVHPGATAAARKIWCAKDRSQAWRSWMLERVQPETAACEGDVVIPLQLLGEKLMINSTPTLIFASGNRNPGLMAAAEIESALAAR
jgi:thiol:disulfide interchange protein DsbC